MALAAEGVVTRDRVSFLIGVVAVALLVAAFVSHQRRPVGTLPPRTEKAPEAPVCVGPECEIPGR